MQITPRAILVPAGLILSVILLRYYGKRKAESKLPPGPKEHWLMGNFLDFYPYVKKGQLFTYLLTQKKTFGKLFRIRGFKSPTYILSDAEIARNILSKGDDFVRGDTLQINARGLLNYSLFVFPSGVQWHKHRKFIQPSFAPVKLRNAEHIINQKTLDAISTWRSMGDKQIDIHEAITLITLDVIGLVAFGHDFNSVKTFDRSITKSLGHLEVIFKTVAHRFSIPSFLWRLTKLDGNQPEIAEASVYFKDLLGMIINKRKLEVEAEFDTPKQIEWTLLDRMLYSSMKEKMFTNEEIDGEMLGFFAAGLETTSNTLTWAVLELSRRPDVVARIRNEVDGLMNLPESELFSRIYDQPYLENFIKEVQRYHSIVGSVSRFNVAPQKMLGYELPANSRIMILIRALHMDEEYWDNPEEFHPQRFEKPVVPGSFIPFGEGQMKCIGFKLALSEMKIILANIVHNFDIELIPDQDLTGIATITYGLKNGLRVHLRDRKTKSLAQ